MRKKAFTLIEILVVSVLVSVIAISGFFLAQSFLTTLDVKVSEDRVVADQTNALLLLNKSVSDALTLKTISPSKIQVDSHVLSVQGKALFWDKKQISVSTRPIVIKADGRTLTVDIGGDKICFVSESTDLLP